MIIKPSDLIGLEWIIYCMIAFGIIYRILFRNWDYYDERGIKCIKGWPILGSFYQVLFGTSSFPDILKSQYFHYPNEEIVGLYEFFGKKLLMIRDPELIRKVTIEDFDYFSNHKFIVDEQIEPLMGRSLVFMRDHKWRKMRAALRPLFTGNKIRLMFPIIIECSQDFVSYIKDTMILSKRQTTMYEMKETFSQFGSNTIANCAFGRKINSIKDPDNEFYTFGKEIANLSVLQMIRFLGYSCFPLLWKLLRVRMIKPKYVTYFRNVVTQTFNYRETNNIVRHDMINLLMEIKSDVYNESGDGNCNDHDVGFSTVQESDINKSDNKFTKWDDDDLIAQSMLFFFAGFETTSTFLSFLSYELVLNPNIQEKLYLEIKHTADNLNGKSLTYEILREMHYLDMVISEGLRKWAPATLSERVTTKPYLLETSKGQKILLNTGDGITIPTFALHLDPKYYPNPEKFDPERFNNENKVNIKPGCYLPFGSGPRNCIGSKFALIQCKSIFYYLLLAFQLEKCDKTPPDPFVFRLGTSNMNAANGFWIQFRLR